MDRWPRLFVPIVLVLVALGARLPTAAQGTPEAGSASGHLVVADPAAEKLYVYDLADLSLAGELDGVAVAAHAGFLALPDGRLLFVDEVSEDLIALRLDGTGGPEVVGRVPVPSPVSHFATNPGRTHLVVGASDARSPLTLIDLDSYTSRSFRVEAGEAGVALGGDPLTVFHRNDELMQVESYPVETLVRGATTPTGVVETGAAGHGEAIAHDLGRFYTATDDGLDAIDVTEDGLAYRATLPWDVSGREGGRGFFVRLAADGRHLFSYAADRGTDETEWATWRNDAWIADLVGDEATRVEIGPGLVYRFALSARYGLFVNIHPDGDNGHLLDADPGSDTFGEIVATIPLDALSSGPRAGESPWEAESRIAAITPDGATGFVSHGGDGLISVIDTEAREVAGRMEVPTPLEGGGYMIAVQEDMPFADTVAR